MKEEQGRHTTNHLITSLLYYVFSDHFFQINSPKGKHGN